MNVQNEIEKHERALYILSDLESISGAINNLNHSQWNFKGTFGHESEALTKAIAKEEAEFKKLIAEYEAIN